MSTEYKVFRAVGAVIAEVKDHGKFSVFAKVSNTTKIDFTATVRRFDVDLARTPSHTAAQQGPWGWNDIRFDDRGVDKTGREIEAMYSTTGMRLGMTSIGSGKLDDQTRGAYVGTAYIEDNYYNTIYPTAIASQDATWPPVGIEFYQLSSIAYSANAAANGDRAGKRYHGFKVKVLDVSGSCIKLEFPPVVGGPGAALGPWWFNLDRTDECDRDPPTTALAGAVSVATSPVVGMSGALFVALPHAVSLLLTGPKLPIGDGG
jgi:hypothetical protein